MLLFSSLLYVFLSSLINCAIVRKRLVYASRISVVAENNNAGVSIDKFILLKNVESQMSVFFLNTRQHFPNQNLVPNEMKKVLPSPGNKPGPGYPEDLLVKYFTLSKLLIPDLITKDLLMSYSPLKS